MPYKYLVLGLFLVLLTACSQLEEAYKHLVEEPASQWSGPAPVPSSVAEDLALDIRRIPDQDQLVDRLLQTLGQPTMEVVYQLDQARKLETQGFSLSVDQMLTLAVDRIPSSYQDHFNFSDQGLVSLMRVTVTNTGQADLSFPYTDLYLTQRGSLEQAFPATSLYPLDTGNLYAILAEASGKLAPGESLSGYLLFTMGEDLLEAARDKHYLQLSSLLPVGPSQAGAGSQAEGLVERDLFLPLSDSVQDLLDVNDQRVDNRPSREWWGLQKSLADDRPQAYLKDEAGEVSLTIQRVELVDFTPFEAYQPTFQNFPRGQALLSIVYQIDNQSKQALLPVDPPASVTMAGDSLFSDYLLINELKGEWVLPGEKQVFAKVFALDALTYYQRWQGEAMDFDIYLWTLGSEGEDLGPDPEEEDGVPDQSGQAYHFRYHHFPRLEYVYDADLVLVELDESLLEDPNQSGEE